MQKGGGKKGQGDATGRKKGKKCCETGECGIWTKCSKSVGRAVTMPGGLGEGEGKVGKAREFERKNTVGGSETARGREPNKKKN